MSFQDSALLLSWVAIVLLALVVAGLVRQVHALGQARPVPGGRSPLGLAAGTRASGFDRLGPGLMLFLDTGCGVCAKVLDAAGALDRPVHAVFAGAAPAPAAPGITVLTDERDGLFLDHAVPATPFAVLVDAGGRVRAAEPVGSAEALCELLSDSDTEVPR
ncbi:hypothetical protein SMC26_45805 [Actinomadura fulvescens]|uniref:Thioredoxin domain-containing protein n=1 Tax=Actinomadura fulvescens TaxID=46160 RepID=A0ABP6BTR2_9ACTN